MVQIIEEAQKRPRFLDQLLTGVQRAVPHGLQQYAENDALKKLTGKDLGGLSPELKKSFAERLAKTPGHEAIAKSLVNQGVSPEDAEFYAHLTTGGQTAFVKDLLESKKRTKKIDKLGAPVVGEEEEIELTPEQKFDRELQEEVGSQDEGLTPAERVKREKERFDTGLKVYEESGTKLRGMARDKERLDILERLSTSDKLPNNLGRLNVDKDGNLRFPFASSPDAQRFVKTLNEFSAGAKDTYGSRVTNFDLQQYMMRYPTLLNSKEGRRQILQQMKTVNQINSVYYKNLKDIYDKAGGVRKIDADRAEMLAEKKSDPVVKELVQKFNQIGQFPTLPNAVEFKGAKIRNKETGETMISDGKNWIPQGQ